MCRCAPLQGFLYCSGAGLCDIHGNGSAEAAAALPETSAQLIAQEVVDRFQYSGSHAQHSAATAVSRADYDEQPETSFGQRRRRRAAQQPTAASSAFSRLLSALSPVFAAPHAALAAAQPQSDSCSDCLVTVIDGQLLAAFVIIETLCSNSSGSPDLQQQCQFVANNTAFCAGYLYAVSYSARRLSGGSALRSSHAAVPGPALCPSGDSAGEVRTRAVPGSRRLRSSAGRGRGEEPGHVMQTAGEQHGRRGGLLQRAAVLSRGGAGISPGRRIALHNGA